MNWADLYLLCFAVGALWTLATLLLGGFHLGHSGGAHTGHAHIGHSHGQVTGAHGHPAHPPAHVSDSSGSHQSSSVSWIGAMANPSCAAVYLAWFGGVGYLLTRHTGLVFWLNLIIAMALGLFGAWILAAFLRLLQSSEQPLDPADYELIGTLGRVATPIRESRTGEVISVRDGARKALCARSENGQPIGRDEEVIVTGFQKGIAYVRTWDAMTQPALPPETLQKETTDVQ